MLEDAEARRRRLTAELAEARRTQAAIEAETHQVRVDVEVLAAGKQALEAEHHDVLGKLASAEDSVRAAEAQAASASRVGATTPVAHPPARGHTRAEQLRTARRIVSEAQARRRELDLGAREQLQRLADLRVGSESARRHLEELTARLETAGAAVARLEQQLAGVGAELQAPARLARALGAEAGAAGPSPLAIAGIPPEMLELYLRAAQRCPGLSWTVLAAIGSIETSHGRSQLPGVRSGANEAGAMGPMQFLQGTWDAYGTDGDGDGDRDVYDPVDAVFGAAAYLCASGAGRIAGLASAIWAYNHADWYVDEVLQLAAAYGAIGLAGDEPVAAQLADHPNLTLTPQARADILGGRVDPRVLRLLAAAAARFPIAVSVIQSGHSKYVKGTDRISNHYHGRAVDIAMVDGAPVSASNEAALELVLDVLGSGSSLRPDEVGSPWQLSRFAGAFADENHNDHIHLAFR